MIDGQVEVLILGSFPSPASLAKKQYYGHPQNHFWKLMSALLGEPLYELAYETRVQMLLKCRIGLWDVLHQCDRAGALDSNIRNAVQNDFRKVTKIARGLKRVCFNGKTAGRFEPVFAEAGYQTLVLPSSSPAYTLALGEKLKHWRAIVEPCAAGLLSSDSSARGHGVHGGGNADDGADGGDGSGARRVRRRPALCDTPARRGRRLAAAM